MKSPFYKPKEKYIDYPYLSWLDYKRRFRIVRYYPTPNMYIKYKWWCLANGYAPYGFGLAEDIAHRLLLKFLKERLQP